MHVFSSPQPRAGALVALLQEQIGDQGCSRLATQSVFEVLPHLFVQEGSPLEAPYALASGHLVQKKGAQEASLVKVGPPIRLHGTGGLGLRATSDVIFVLKVQEISC